MLIDIYGKNRRRGGEGEEKETSIIISKSH